MTKQMKKAVSADSNTDKAKKNQHYYLICERKWLYFVLIAVAGFWGAFSYLLRGDVFCNAQTGYVVLMGLALGTGLLYLSCCQIPLNTGFWYGGTLC